ncbi:hypothetical protein WJX81_001661 [Elliptochloris bilobata]|uniref:C2H2-type domain-containing protein n=1 Tax=Elliptochloris bilobata TaxID=381761 RepID=A0AAW1RLN5_9CHLO
MGKAKPASHTAKELAMKAAASTTNKGGGVAGKADRLGGAAGHSKYKCPICAQQAPDMKTMQIHHEAKHSKVPFVEASIINLHEVHGGTTQGIAVRGSTKKK